MAILCAKCLGIILCLSKLYNKTEVTALPKIFFKKQVNLGLDLQGGSHYY